jgi:hypothetical protein
MAKNKSSLIKLQGTFANITFVNSKTYGDHMRHARGTHTDAVLNEVMQKQAGNASPANAAAKVVHDHIQIIAVAFKQKALWQVMLSRVRSVAVPLLVDLLGSLEGLEINEAYPLDRLVALPRIGGSASSDTLLLTMETVQHPHFPDAIQTDGYYYTVHVLWVTADGENGGSEAIETEWIRFSEELPFYELAFDRPMEACYGVLLLEVRAGLREVAEVLMGGRGMRVVGIMAWND